ncbi:HAD family hydrolase [Methylobacterium soli]|uniref:HAD hydrolase-like protein n=2 Tax=Methylobacterium soli TaxID=553447 RepID=A0A6L3SZ02_9HYPH|nr:HAD family hydrolase [Methylobacterium soli]KAB1077482.1 HAD hydrolase-like protein [Methylobacterium soli]
MDATSPSAPARPSLLVRLREPLEAAEAVSFDVFDTLFVRLIAAPEDVFDLVGARFGLKHFRRHRIAAQAQAFRVMRAEGRREIDLDGIYACLPDLGVPAEALKRAEWAAELAVLRLNPEVHAVLVRAQALGKPCILTSDMYLPAGFFAALCERAGITVDRLFISSEAQATKRDDGALFTRAAEALGLSPGRILHIGDNPASDIARGAEKGLATFHYAPDLGPARPTPDLAHAIVAGIARFQAFQPDRSPWWHLGYAAGAPATHALVEWLRGRAEEDRIDLLLFLARDGFTAHRLWPGEATPSLYFKASRVLLRLAAVTERNFEAQIPFLLSGAASVADIFARIGVELPDEAVLRDLGFTAETRYTRKRHAAFAALMRAMRWRILQVCRASRRGLHAACLQAGFRDGMRLGLVDVGWKGSTQAAFLAFVQDFFDVRVKGYYVCLHAKARKGLEMEALISGATHRGAIRRALYDNRVVAELLFSAPHASITGARLEPDGSVAFTQDPGRGADPRLPAIAAEIDAGIRDGVALLRDLLAEIRIELPVAALTAPMLALARDPSRDQAEIIGSIYNFDSWGSSRLFRSYAARLDPREAARGDSWPAGMRALTAPRP